MGDLNTLAMINELLRRAMGEARAIRFWMSAISVPNVDCQVFEQVWLKSLERC